MAAIQSILIVGATGRTGIACLSQLARLPIESRPSIHAFCRNKSKLSEDNSALCKSITEGDARSANDLESALQVSKADVVILSVGNGDSVAKSDIRTANAKAIVDVLQSKPQYHHVRVIAVSSTGAGGSRIKVGMGIGKLIERHLRHVLHDHDGQELALASICDRLTVVRPTALTDDSPTGHLVEFGDVVKSPTIKTDRADLASWIVEEALSGNHAGVFVNVTSVKPSSKQ